MSTIAKLTNRRKISGATDDCSRLVELRLSKIRCSGLIFLRDGNIELMFIFASVCFVLSLIVLGSRTVDRLIDRKSLCVVTIGRLIVLVLIVKFIEREIKPRLNVLAVVVCSLLSAFVVDFIDVVCYKLLLLLLFLRGRSPNKVICKVFFHQMSKSLMLLSSCYCFESFHLSLYPG